MRGLPVAVATAVLGSVVLAGCGSDPVPGGASDTVICGKALGVVVLSEVGDDAQRRARHAQETADVLSTLANQTADQSLAQALRAAAAEARQVRARDWSATRLKAWALKEQQRFDSLRRACT
jgi:hypothetical protein